MDIRQINQTLTSIFKEEKKRIVFWYDEEKEFEESLPLIQVGDVTVLRLDQIGALDLKIKIETLDNKGNYLLYAPYYEPAPEKDWLVDIRLYSYTFHADKASILMNELGLENQSLRPFIKARKAFFRNQDRLDRLKKWVEPNDREDDIDLKMLTVLTRAAQPDPFAILMKLMESLCKSGSFIPDGESKPWKDIEALELESSFWKFMARTFGYVNESSPALSDLLIKVFVTDFSNQYKKELPVSLGHFRLTGSSKVMNASVFLSQWQTHTIQCKNFNRVSKFIAQKLNMDQILSSLDIEDLLDVMTFENVERRIISSFRDQVIDNYTEKDFSTIQDAVKKRLDGYWTNITFDDDIKENLYKTAYQALTTAINLFDLRKKFDAGFSYKSAGDMFNAYTRELYFFDQYYRLFNESADKTEQVGWDILKQLRSSVEDCYSNWFMDKLCLCWGDFLESDQGLLNAWHLPGIRNQYNFFKDKIKSDYVKSDRKRIFVIISDAFRYEAGKELTDRINGKYRLKAEIEPMLGVLPGFTALGMASLLPYNTLSFKEGSTNPLIDGKPNGSFEQRAAILDKYEGTAIKASDLSAMSKDKGREFVKPHKVIYIYHDQIDATGDKAVSEDRTFEAVRTTIDELTALVGFIINSLNGTRVMITADHGFIYQDKKPDNLDKSILDIEPQGIVKKHKRFIMGKGLGVSEKVVSGNTRQTAKTDTDMEFWLPKGTNRFNFVGGAKFFHGGAMLQEIVIPVVTVSEMKGIHKEKSQISRVGVSLLGSMKKIVTNIPRFEFIQTDAVSQRMKPRMLKISLRDGNELISSEETITFDSNSSSMDDRKKAVKLGLKSGPFDNKKEYALVLRNAEDETEYERLPLMIDIAFANDF
ncbi:BREX-1 system phosphatase PglZ type A [uncultured Desulfobacter sp.]|uniref:BREX-1 system phosphatase PglZ type A n=2 Tax=Desulfobacter TaxID=2289 RepID=UPI0029C7018D|nr:BREX-1 system phosphatase PglZ type A [uncultured Desulfobacter sp.]